MSSSITPEALAFLDRAIGSLHDLLRSGLSAVSSSSIEQLRAGFQEASRLRLLRLGSTLRQLIAEVDRFADDADEFSARRFMFFANRAWLLATAMERAHRLGDEEAMGALLLTPSSEPRAAISLVCIGVVKKHVPERFCSFEFRLRELEDGEWRGLFTWSCVFALRKGLDLPPEVFLGLDQAQGFKPRDFLTGEVIDCKGVAVRRGDGPALTLQMLPDSAVSCRPAAKSSGRSEASPFDSRAMPSLDLDGALKRLSEWAPDPLELEIDRIEDATFEEFMPLSEPPLSELSEPSGEVRWWSWELDHLVMDVRIEAGPAGDELIEALLQMLEKPTLRLYGTVHYESLRLAFQPLSAATPSGLVHLGISTSKVSKADLVKAMNFR